MTRTALSCAMSDVLAGRRTTETEAARHYAHQFTPARVADFYLAEYAALLAAPQNGAPAVLARSALP